MSNKQHPTMKYFWYQWNIFFSIQGVSVTAMDDILYSRTVQDCERFCDDVRSPSIQQNSNHYTNLKHWKQNRLHYFYDNCNESMIFFQARAFNCRSFSQQGDRCYLRWFFSFTLANIVQDHNVCEKQSIHFHRSVTDFCGKSLFPSQRRRLGHSSRFHATRGAGGWSLRKYLIASQNRSTCCEKIMLFENNQTE